MSRARGTNPTPLSPGTQAFFADSAYQGKNRKNQDESDKDVSAPKYEDIGNREFSLNLYHFHEKRLKRENQSSTSNAAEKES